MAIQLTLAICDISHITKLNKWKVSYCQQRIFFQQNYIGSDFCKMMKLYRKPSEIWVTGPKLRAFPVRCTKKFWPLTNHDETRTLLCTLLQILPKRAKVYLASLVLIGSYYFHGKVVVASHSSRQREISIFINGL